MKTIEQMIKEMCPEGVEYVRLGDIAEVMRGRRLTKKELSNDNIYPVYHGGVEPIGFYYKANRLENTVMIINVGASAGTVGYCKSMFWSSDGCFCISHSVKLNSRFLFYHLSTRQNYLMGKVRHAGIPTLDAKIIENLEIPLPPLEIQNEIVRILDKFTTLEAELEAELDCRKRQYEFYRDKLLTFNKIGGVRKT